MDKLNQRILKKDPQHMFFCEFCGSKVPSYNQDFGFCYFCELGVSSLEEVLQRYPDFYSALSILGKGISEAKWGNAEKGLQKLLTIRESPEMDYVAGVFYNHYSDYMYANRDYQYLAGFREPNADNIKAGIELFYKSKEMFYKAIDSANRILQANGHDEQRLFVKFLSEFRLKRMVDARQTLKLLNEVSNGATSVYASMLYSSTMHSKGSFTFIKQLTDMGIVNSFYYYARFITSDGNLNEAKSILVRLLSKVNMPRAKSLLQGIQEVQEIL